MPNTDTAAFTFIDDDESVYRVAYERDAYGAHIFTASRNDEAGVVQMVDFENQGEPMPANKRESLAIGAAEMLRHKRAKDAGALAPM